MTEDDIKKACSKYTDKFPLLHNGVVYRRPSTEDAFRAGAAFICRSAEIELGDIPTEE